MNCKGCPYEGNIRYHFVEGNDVLPEFTKAEKDIFDKATRNNTQCQYHETKRSDGKMVMIQTCGPKELTAIDVASLTPKSFSVKRAPEARDYLQANSVDWWVDPASKV